VNCIASLVYYNFVVILVPVEPTTADEGDSNAAPIIGGVVAFIVLMIIGVALFFYLSRYAFSIITSLFSILDHLKETRNFSL